MGVKEIKNVGIVEAQIQDRRGDVAAGKARKRL